jgi:hypothetical protein
MEEGEERSHSGQGPRIVRIGTHALKIGSGTTLWKRLSQHKGQEKSGRGNHRGSLFRLIVGTALNTDNTTPPCPTWGQGNSADKSVRAAEIVLEERVSHIIGRMPFVWLAIADEPGPASLRGYIERNAIALLSNYGKPAIDSPSPGWLGHKCNRQRFGNPGSGIRITSMKHTIRHFSARSKVLLRAIGQHEDGHPMRCNEVAGAGHLRAEDGRRLLFVADPANAPPEPDTVYARPDDPAFSWRTWRQLLVDYNSAPTSNLLALLPAYRLYGNRVYQRLVSTFGPSKVSSFLPVGA